MKSSAILGIILLTVRLGLPQAYSAESVNARDFGASGSKFETTATTTAGSKQITVANVGDFKVGQGAMVSRCNIRYVNPTLWGPGEPYVGASKDTGVEIRGYDGSAGSWIVFLLEIDSTRPTFRWSNDLARSWKGTKVPVTYDWQPLSGGIKVRFSRRDWKPGHMISFSTRDQLVSVIEKIEGNVLTLHASANRTANDAVVGHCDSMALQAALDRAIREKRNVFIPVGRYRLANGLKQLYVWLGDGKWDVIHFNFGIHDQHAPLADYEERLEKIVARLQKTAAKLVWASTTPIPKDEAKKQTPESIVERNAVAMRVMKRHGIAVDDLFAFITPHLATVQNPHDVHFNGKGYDLLGTQVAEAALESLRTGRR